MIDSSSSPDACVGNVFRILSRGDFSPDDFFVSVMIDSSSSPDACVGNVVRILSRGDFSPDDFLFDLNDDELLRQSRIHLRYNYSGKDAPVRKCMV